MGNGKRILLTGATGFVGRALGQALVAGGWEVVALVRELEGAGAGLPFPAELHPWRPEKALADIDAVVHLAGETVSKRWTPAQKEKILRSRVSTTRQLRAMLGAVEGRRPAVHVGVSAVGIYGDRGAELLTEDARPGGGFLAETCLAWEAATAELAEVVPRTVVLRLGLVLGAGGGALARMLPVFRCGLGGRLGSGRQWLSWIHLQDLVGMILFALENGNLRGTFNAVSPEPVTNRELTRALAAALGRPAPFPVPAFVLRLALGEMASMLLGSQRVSSRRIQEAGFRFRFASAAPALRNACGTES